VRLRAAFIVLAAGVLLLTPQAPAGVDVPGDPTPPVVTPVITGTLGLNGWYTTNVTLSWSIVDPESIILSTTGCDTTTLTSDTTGVTRTCSATSDGGTTTVSKTFKIDKTAPQATGSTRSRGADSNGWYNHALTVSFQGSDATSGIAGCSQVDYSAPDRTNATVSGSCQDNAGNQSTALTSAAFNYDATAPQATTSPSRPPDKNGWYNAQLTVGFSATDTLSGLDSCPAPKNYAGPDNVLAVVSGSCLDRAGNTATASFALSYDGTAPVSIHGSPGRQPDANGWYNRPLTVTFEGSDPTSGLDVCTQTTYRGPDDPSVAMVGSCSDKAGNQGNSGSFTFKYDQTSPQVTGATPSRQPDANGWYNRPLTVAFAGADATSSIAGCSSSYYAGPDGASATVAGSCTDNAGNVAGGSFALKYDNTAPTIVAVNTKLGNRSAQVGWRKSGDTQVVEVVRVPGRNGAGESVVYRGPEDGFVDTGLAVGHKYEYRVTGFDAAANRSERTVDLIAAGALLVPAPGAKVKAPPTLDWIPVKGATYYNLQIVRGRKVLSTWPVQSSFRLHRTWMFNERRYRLRPGVYRWYVWPGFGRISASRYGRLLGSSTFVVAG
jgi:hypothetical protein